MVASAYADAHRAELIWCGERRALVAAHRGRRCTWRRMRCRECREACRALERTLRALQCGLSTAQMLSSQTTALTARVVTYTARACRPSHSPGARVADLRARDCTAANR